MINPKIFKAVLASATKETKDLVINELLNHLSLNYDYNDEKAGHIIEMLVDKDEVVTSNRVNLKWIEEHLERLMYQHEKYIIRNITVGSIDNIDCLVKFNFEYIQKDKEFDEDVKYIQCNCFVSFTDYPQILK